MAGLPAVRVAGLWPRSPLLLSKALTHARGPNQGGMGLPCSSQRFAMWLKKAPLRGGSAKHERQGVRRSKNKFTWFSSSDSMSVLSQHLFSAALCLPRHSPAPFGRELRAERLVEWATAGAFSDPEAFEGEQAVTVCFCRCGSVANISVSSVPLW